jgi:hypothetical protein
LAIELKQSSAENLADGGTPQVRSESRQTYQLQILNRVTQAQENPRLTEMNI